MLRTKKNYRWCADANNNKWKDKVHSRNPDEKSFKNHKKVVMKFIINYEKNDEESQEQNACVNKCTDTSMA